MSYPPVMSPLALPPSGPIQDWVVVTDPDALKWQQHFFALLAGHHKQLTDKMMKRFATKFKVGQDLAALIETAGDDKIYTTLNVY